MAANIAKLPELLEKHQLFCFVVLVLNAIAKFGVARTEIRQRVFPSLVDILRFTLGNDLFGFANFVVDVGSDQTLSVGDLRLQTSKQWFNYESPLSHWCFSSNSGSLAMFAAI